MIPHKKNEIKLFVSCFYTHIKKAPRCCIEPVFYFNHINYFLHLVLSITFVFLFNFRQNEKPRFNESFWGRKNITIWNYKMYLCSESHFHILCGIFRICLCLLKKLVLNRKRQDYDFIIQIMECIFVDLHTFSYYLKSSLCGKTIYSSQWANLISKLLKISQLKEVRGKWKKIKSPVHSKFGWAEQALISKLNSISRLRW